MFAAFHFLFEVCKIALLAALYSSIILLITFIFNRITVSSSAIKANFSKTFFIIACLMFVFSFTYWGDHGLGDEANLPLGHGRTMRSSDGYPYFYLEPSTQINIDSFLVRNEHLYFISGDNYYDYKLISGKWNKYNKQEYERLSFTHQLPQINELKTFYPQYDAYWNGWRFWLLP